MKRTTCLAEACLLSGLLVVALVSGLRTSARAARAADTCANVLDVVINEVAWMGTPAGYTNEWIELYNTSDQAIDLTNWSVVAADGTPNISLSGVISAHGYFLLERLDDSTVSDIPANLIYTGALENSPDAESLTLYDDTGQVVDKANADGGDWPAGNNSTKHTMERFDPTAPDTDANWATNDGATRNGLDANGNPINGTPKAQNSCHATPGLNLAKLGPAVATAGLTLTCRLSLSNTGNLAIATVVLTDSLPVGLEFFTQTSPYTFTQPTPGTLRWEVGDIPTNALYLITLTLHVADTLSGTVTNVATATEQTGRTETASWTAPVLPCVRLYALAPANYGGSKEAAALFNQNPHTVSLNGWRLNDDPGTGGLSFPVTATIGPGQIIWLAQDADGFYPAWGHDADWAAQSITRPIPTLDGSWPGFTDHGEAAYLLDADDYVVDTLAYGTGAATAGWNGAAVPYPYVGYGAGQVLYRKLNQATGLPVPDTDTSADWAQDPGDPINGRKLRYPGWDLEGLFFPAEITTTTTFTLAVAPDGALDLALQAIASAQHTLHVEAYTLESLALYQTINDRIQAGVAVTILLESSPTGGMDDVEKWIVQRLHNPPTNTVYFLGQTAPRYRYQHAKFLLVDERLALVSSDNFGEHSMPSDPKDNGTMGNRGFVAVTDSPGIIARLAEVFRRDCDPMHHLDVTPYDDTYAPPPNFTPLPPPDWTTYTAAFTAPLVTTATHVTVLHAPENSLRDQDALLGLLNRAGSGDRLVAMQLNEPVTWTAGMSNEGLNPRIQALVAAAHRGAQVRLLLDRYYDNGGNTATCLYLNNLGHNEGLNIICRLANVSGLGIHAKVFLVSVGDERWTHLGSINGTENSNKNNREVALEFRSVGAYEWMQTIFEHDWELGHGPMTYPVYLPWVMRDYAPPADHPLITEIFVNPDGDDANQEWLELYNPGAGVNIAGWTLGDAINTGDYGDGRYAFPTGTQLLHGQVVAVAACAANFSITYGFNPAYEWMDCDPAVPNLTPVASWDGFGIALGNESDETLLLDESGALVDSTAWGSTPRAGVIPFTDFITPFPSGACLKRYPPDTDRDDCSRDFYVSYNPSPGHVTEY
ncbi:MAG: lamin tail domain-containing protein [Chloroflexota bacterium]|nr:lamin tail domain-containing protein [Chloroflexota bacterium]